MNSNLTLGPAFLTPKFRVSFANVFQPSSFNDSKPSYNMTMLFPKAANLDIFKNALREVAKMRWGTKIPQLALPFTDGDTKSYDGYAGMFAIKVANYIYKEKDAHKAKPGIVDMNRVPILTPAEFYSGCYARATIFAKATGGPGTGYAAKVSFGLRNIQKLEEGEAFGVAAVAAEDDFEAYGPAAATPSSDVSKPEEGFDFLSTGADAGTAIPW